MQQLLTSVIAIARQASQVVMALYQENNFSISQKADASPLTQADLAANAVIMKELQQLPEAYPIVSEEQDLEPYSVRRHWPRYWLVDPIDGTKEFIARTGEFTINIALIEQGVPILGVVSVPATAELYYAAHTVGAFYTHANARQLLQTQPMSAGQGVIVTSRSHGRRHEVKKMQRQPPLNWTVLYVGSSLKLCWLAHNKADIYPRLGPTSAWDTAAAHSVLLYAGGDIFVRATGQPLRYNHQDSIRNPEFVAVADPQFDWQHYFSNGE